MYYPTRAYKADKNCDSSSTHLANAFDNCHQLVIIDQGAKLVEIDSWNENKAIRDEIRSLRFFCCWKQNGYCYYCCCCCCCWCPGGTVSANSSGWDWLTDGGRGLGLSSQPWRRSSMFVDNFENFIQIAQVHKLGTRRAKQPGPHVGLWEKNELILSNIKFMEQKLSRWAAQNCAFLNKNNRWDDWECRKNGGWGHSINPLCERHRFGQKNNINTTSWALLFRASMPTIS